MRDVPPARPRRDLDEATTREWRTPPWDDEPPPPPDTPHTTRLRGFLERLAVLLHVHPPGPSGR